MSEYRSRGEALHGGHTRMRGVLRVLGPALLAAGVICCVIAGVDFFSSFGSRGGPTMTFSGSSGFGARGGGIQMGQLAGPQRFWLFFVGMPLMAVGGVMTKVAFMGKVARYVAAETAPVAKDTFNYMAHGTRGGVRALAGAIGEGLRGDPSRPSAGAEGIPCPACGRGNDPGQGFCGHCGQGLARARVCNVCHTESAPDHRSCGACGEQLTRRGSRG